MDPSLDAVLPPGVARAAGPPPAPPADYDEGYALPAHSEKPLQALHAHALDARLAFYEAPHVYTFDGVPTSLSSTGLAHAHQPPFDGPAAIGLMKASRAQAWPRREYVVDARPLAESGWTPARGALRVRDGKTVAVAQPDTLFAGATREHLLALLGATSLARKGEAPDPGVREDEVHTFAREKADAEILEGWAQNGRIASHKGTEAHYGAELFFNGLPMRWWEPDMGVLFDFCRAHLLPKGLVAYRTEMEVVCADADLAGSIDLLVRDPASGVVHIVDHKRTDKLRASLRGFGKMSAPFAHLDDCKAAGYAIQVSIYQYILQREYGMAIGDRVLLSLHADAPFATSVPYLAAEVAYLMESRFALVRARRAVAAAEPARFACALTGAPAVDAVRLADGRVAMEKAALVRGEAGYAADGETRAAFEAAVEARREPVALDVARTLPWRKRMPEGGIPPFA
jgi:hypothetical protein